MRVVMLRPLGLGDFLTAVPAYRAIARAFPTADRVLAAPSALAPLVPLVGDAITQVQNAAPLRTLDHALRRPDVAIDLHGRGPASHRVLLALRPHRLIAFENAQVVESAGGATWHAGEHEVARWCRLLTHAGIAADPADLELLRPAEASPAAGATLVHPGAASRARQWPVERWAEVVRAERAAGRRVILTGSMAEVPLVVAVATRAGLPDVDRLAGRTTLDSLAVLVAGAGRVVSGDTGVAHLATAFRTPSVTLFGPVSPLEWGPPSRPIHRAIWKGRRGDPHGEVTDPGLAEIEPADVLAELRVLDRLAPVRVSA